MRQGIINRRDTRIVFNQIARVKAVRPVSDRRRIELHFFLQRRDQRLNDVLTKPFALQNNRPNIRHDNRIKHQRTHTGLLIYRVYLFFYRFRPAFIFDKGQGNTVDSNRKLRHHRVPEHFGGNCRPVGNIKNVAIDSAVHK